jgi:hypothetical protein
MRVRRADNDPDRVVVYWMASDDRTLVEIDLSLAEAAALQNGRRDQIPNYYRRMQHTSLDQLNDEQARDRARLAQLEAEIVAIRDIAWLQHHGIEPLTDERPNRGPDR